MPLASGTWGNLLWEASFPPKILPLPVPWEFLAMHALVLCLLLAAAPQDPFPAWYAEAATVNRLPDSAGTVLDEEQLIDLESETPTMPFPQAHVGLRTPQGEYWVGTPQGLLYLAPDATRWRVFHSRRWLPADDVRGLSLTDDGTLFVETSAGIGKIGRRETTLEEKMLDIDAMLQKHHLRDGFVTEISLPDPGNLDSAQLQATNDNDGLWTSIYVCAEAFRYGATQDPLAKQNARRSLEALMFLERISTIPGFVARSAIPISDDPKRHGGEWHRSADNRWWWKADTSSDEVVGHYMAYQVYYDIAADDQEKEEIRGYVERITDNILDHGLYYVGPPGTPTTWGVWAPDGLNHDLRRIGDRGLNSLEILSHLKVAEHIVGKPRYTAKLKELIEEHGYATNTVAQKQIWPAWLVNHSDDELAFMSYYPLLILERDPHLRRTYLASIRRSWQIERPEGSPLFNLIYGAALQASVWTNPLARPDWAYVEPADYDQAVCLAWFRDVPSDTIGWSIKNTHRRDISIVGNNRERRPKSETVLPVSERRIMRWNGDPYTLDGGSGGRERDDGAAILLPYWMGRYHRLLD